MEKDKFLGKTLSVIIDRPIGSVHPRVKDYYYPLNYGYIPNTTGGDGDEVDVYVLGEHKPKDQMVVTIIAKILRVDDNECKYVAAPPNKNYTDDQIMALLEFQEKYYNSKIIRAPGFEKEISDILFASQLRTEYKS